MDYVAVPWITDYLEELRAMVKNCDPPQDAFCPPCRERLTFIARIEQILKEHGR
jgi:hypothetical protein